ncbi:cytochrome b6-f complex iron-sulfur subunit 2, chloroplastic [Iris pallida]|uniref:Cytochrome b6-f complex iron-sulfur subunit 2, chloroplastic n=1 Tax=Iris pallida TaxID=29817 RepID=A0AAX6DYZ2_IRIPA|nr:cytochrome b6-f complex iron-sulfur subunit 2, chloroplastic [Iris pallida]
MASTTLSTAATTSQLCSGKNGMSSPTSRALLAKPAKGWGYGRERSMRVSCMGTSIPADRVPDMEKRKLMNLLLLGAISLPSAGMLVPRDWFFFFHRVQEVVVEEPQPKMLLGMISMQLNGSRLMGLVTEHLPRG